MASGSDWAYWNAQQAQASNRAGRRVRSVRRVAAKPSPARLRGITRRGGGTVDLPIF